MRKHNFFFLLNIKKIFYIFFFLKYFFYRLIFLPFFFYNLAEDGKEYLAILDEVIVTVKAEVTDTTVSFTFLDKTDSFVVANAADKDDVLFEPKNLSDPQTAASCKMFDCVNGYCVTTGGVSQTPSYFIHNSNNSLAKCTSGAVCEDYTAIACNDNAHLGGALKDSDNAINLCVNVGGTQTKKNLGKNGEFYFSVTAANDPYVYSRYITDSTGNIISKSAPGKFMNFFLFFFLFFVN